MRADAAVETPSLVELLKARGWRRRKTARRPFALEAANQVDEQSSQQGELAEKLQMGED